MVAINKEKCLTTYEIWDNFVVDAVSGEIFWRRPKSGRSMGKLAGSLNSAGYRRISLIREGEKLTIYAHHIVWAWVHGVWPAINLDHINGNRDDNRISNLREASHRENRVNTGPSRKNACGLKWVKLDKCSATRNLPKPWSAAVWFGKERRHAYFADKNQAYEWAKSIAKDLHGEFFNPG